MYLKKVTIKNFRCFEDLEISLDKRLTVFIGNNGVGKTTILNAISVAISTILQPFENVSSLSLSKNDARIQINHTINGREDPQSIYPVSVTAEAIVDNEGVIWTRSLNSSKSKTTIVDAKNIINLFSNYKLRLQKGDTNLILPLILFYGTGRLYDFHREKKYNSFKTDNRLNGYIDCMDSSANVKLMSNWFKSKTAERIQDIEAGVEPDYALNIVTGIMEKIFSEVSNYSDVKIQYSLIRDEIIVWYTDFEGKRMCLPLNNLSDGYRNTLSLIADISYRMVLLNPNLGMEVLQKTPGIVLIDELDQHLHPSWQQRIVSDLQLCFPNIQFIVTTHAPSIINTLKQENVKIISGLKVMDCPIETYGKDNNGIIKNIMDVNDRPSDISNMFNTFYSLLDDEKYDEAEIILEQMEEILDSNDAELIQCRIKLELEKM